MTITAWLIERGQLEHQTPTVWWSGIKESNYSGIGFDQWTEDSNKAHQFATKELAEEVIKERSGILGVHPRLGRATEHIWLTRESMEGDAMTNTKTGHTALPWQSVEVHGETIVVIGVLGNHAHGTICRLRQADTNSQEENEANAEFIVRAANNFEALLEALTKIAMAPEGTYSRDKEQYLKNVIAWCQETAQAAIAQAEKETP